ncbi:MAG TPA: glycosyltransferase [Methanocella sp.]|uniref:glycosyltransferase n=1 Tax=Methanocella sp. TaxID=2052833 RepID=UPI002B96624F|nr:glycosyltransferase [Methanocella sp.]HTY91059.1 glycosyltransferase [Methanocella sp.]
MKIAVFTDTFFPQVNGVVNAVRNFDRTLSGRGHEVRVFTEGRKPGTVEMDGAEVHRYQAFTFLPYPEFESSVDAIRPIRDASRFKPEVVHAHTPFVMGYCAWRTARRLKVPLVGTFHTPVDEYVVYIAKRFTASRHMLQGIAKAYQNWFYGNCDVVIVPARSAARYIDIKNKRVEVVSNGLDLKRYGRAGRGEFRERFGLGDAPVILHGGRLSFEKRIDGVIRAMPLVLGAIPDAKLLIVGKGPSRKSLDALVEKLGLQESVVFTGYVGDEDFPKAFAAADVLALNSPVETQSLIVLEAFATGVPVVGADAGAIPDAVVPGENGFLFNTDDTKALAGYLIAVLGDKALRERLGQGALSTASEHSLEKSTDRLLAVYRSAIEKKA